MTSRITDPVDHMKATAPMPMAIMIAVPANSAKYSGRWSFKAAVRGDSRAGIMRSAREPRDLTPLSPQWGKSCERRLRS